VTKLRAAHIEDLDPYKFMATIGMRVIHPRGYIVVAARKPA
jgi:hypothetical protein